MLESVRNQIDNMDLISFDFIKTNQLIYSKNKIVEFDKTENLVLKFHFILTAMSRNGGLIAVCKTKGYLDEKRTKINDNIIVMHQDAKTRYHIPIDWDYNTRYIISIEFNEKEQLYAFCNDGTIYKIDILNQKAVETTFSSVRLKSEGLHKVKLFEKGYIALTEKGSIYLVEELKNGEPQFIISVREQLGFTNDIDFIGIPANKTCSKKFELLITNQKGEGVLHVERQDLNKIGDNRRSFQYEKKDDSNKGKVVDVSLLNSPNLENYNNNVQRTISEIPTHGFELIDSQLKTEYESKKETKDKIGNVTAMSISPSQDYIALYVSESNTLFHFSSQISTKNNKMNKLKFELDYSIDKRELKEQQKVLSYKNDLQLLFCEDDAVAICGGKYIMMINKKNETIPILVEEENKQFESYIYCRGISEVDGIRYMTDKEIYLISPVSSELGELCDEFQEESLTRKLVIAYGNYISKNPFCNNQIREIGDNLPNTIKDLAIAAANIYWSENEPETHKRRDTQNFIIKAAQFGKSLVQKEIFNFDRFNDICKSIRIINNMRNYPVKQRYITYNEYLDMNPDFPSGIINKTMRQLNFKLAHEICKFLGDDEKHIYLRYAIAKIKKLPSVSDTRMENDVYDHLMLTFQNAENISYIEIAKKCIKYHKYDLAEKFLKNEKSVLVKIPQYLKLGKWNKALELSLKSCDLNVIKVVIDKIYKVESPTSFNNIMGKYPQAHSAVINYYKSITKYEELNNYLNMQKDKEELLFISLENFFKSQTLEERKKHLEEAKKCLSGAKNIDYTFYKNYLSDLSNSLKFKEQCFEQDKNIIEKNDITTFDNSIYDCFQKAKPEKYSWIETQNKKYFEISKRKMSILRFRALAEEKKFDEIEQIIQKEGYKKLDISPLKIANIFYEFQKNDKAVEYALLEDNKDLYDDKFNFLMLMGKYLEAVQAALSDKKYDLKHELINKVLYKKPELKSKVEELCIKYKVSF